MTDKKIEKSYQEHKNTSTEVGKALVSKNFDNSLNYAEIGLDTFISDDVLKEIPIVKTIVGVVKSGLKVKEIFFSKKILTFLKEFHSSKLPVEKLEKFQIEFNSKIKYREKVLQEIMVLNDNFIQIEKSKIFANLFSAHLNEAYGWNDFMNLSYCLSQLNMFGVPLFDDMSKFNKPFFGAIDHDKRQLYPLLINSGTISVWGNHLDITQYGLFLYHYGIKGKIEEDISKAYPDLFKSQDE
jgi:hypothetical protein